MNKIQSDLELILKNTQTLSAFVSRYGDSIPDDLVSISCGDRPFCRIDLDYIKEENERNRALSVIAKVFGAVGWVAEPSNYKSNHFNWAREIDGVKIQIDGAEQLPPLVKHEVDPKQFPLMLEDV